MSALICWHRQLRKKAERKTRNKPRTTVRMVSHKPPRLTKHGEVWMLVFSEDANMAY